MYGKYRKNVGKASEKMSVKKPKKGQKMSVKRTEKSQKKSSIFNFGVIECV